MKNNEVQEQLLSDKKIREAILSVMKEKESAKKTNEEFQGLKKHLFFGCIVATSFIGTLLSMLCKDTTTSFVFMGFTWAAVSAVIDFWNYPSGLQKNICSGIIKVIPIILGVIKYNFFS